MVITQIESLTLKIDEKESAARDTDLNAMDDTIQADELREQVNLCSWFGCTDHGATGPTSE